MNGKLNKQIMLKNIQIGTNFSLIFEKLIKISILNM